MTRNKGVYNFLCGSCGWHSFKFPPDDRDTDCESCGTTKTQISYSLVKLLKTDFEEFQSIWLEQELTPEMKNFYDKKKKQFQLEILL